MPRMLDIQTASAMTVVSAFIASEAAASYLQAHPASTWAWRLNMGVFRVFENLRVDVVPAQILFGRWAMPAAIAVLGLIFGARLMRSRFGLALFANLSFLGSVTLAYAAVRKSPPHETASLFWSGHARPVDLLLIGTLLVASFVGFCVSHWSFVRDIGIGSAEPA